MAMLCTTETQIEDIEERDPLLYHFGLPSISADFYFWLRSLGTGTRPLGPIRDTLLHEEPEHWCAPIGV